MRKKPTELLVKLFGLKDSNKKTDSSEPTENRNRKTFRELILTPTVFIAIITTLGGSLAVGFLSHIISKRQLEHKVITDLMEFTKEADLDSAQNILKLEAYIKLLKDKKKLKARVRGFERIINDFRKDKLHELEEDMVLLSNKLKKTEDIYNTKTGKLAQLKKELEKIDEKSQKERKSIENEISKTKKEIENVSDQKQQLERKYKQKNNENDNLSKDLRVSEKALKKTNRHIKVLEIKNKELEVEVKLIKDLQRTKDIFERENKNLKQEKEFLKLKNDEFKTINESKEMQLSCFKIQIDSLVTDTSRYLQKIIFLKDSIVKLNSTISAVKNDTISLN